MIIRIYFNDFVSIRVDWKAMEILILTNLCVFKSCLTVSYNIANFSSNQIDGYSNVTKISAIKYCVNQHLTVILVFSISLKWHASKTSEIPQRPSSTIQCKDETFSSDGLIPILGHSLAQYMYECALIVKKLSCYSMRLWPLAFMFTNFK